MERVRIAQVAPIFFPVPPKGYGGTELIVSNLTEELVRRGHDVTLFASGDSRTKAQLFSVYPIHLFAERQSWEEKGNLLSLKAVLERVLDFDLIHSHVDTLSALALLSCCPKPVVVTSHNPFPSYSGGDRVHKLFREKIVSKINLVAVSRFFAKQYTEVKYKGVIHHGIDLGRFPFVAKEGEFLLWLGVVNEEKGPHLAIEVAKKTRQKLILGGKVLREHLSYFEKRIKPHLGPDIKFIGEVKWEDKAKFFGNAKAFLFPIMRDEPFGLVVLEALASGVPVISFRRGATPELIEDGVTGFLVEGVRGMVQALAKIDKIDRRKCRRHVEDHFTVKKMVDGYESVYQKILNKDFK
jgi:glycosyltransferase involved in cell wall biosynthesis